MLSGTRKQAESGARSRKEITSEITFKGYTVHTSKEKPQYLIRSDKTDYLAMHKGPPLKKIGKIKRSTKEPGK